MPLLTPFLFLVPKQCRGILISSLHCPIKELLSLRQACSLISGHGKDQHFGHELGHEITQAADLGQHHFGLRRSRYVQSFEHLASNPLGRLLPGLLSPKADQISFFLSESGSDYLAQVTHFYVNILGDASHRISRTHDPLHGSCESNSRVTFVTLTSATSPRR